MPHTIENSPHADEKESKTSDQLITQTTLIKVHTTNLPFDLIENSLSFLSLEEVFKLLSLNRAWYFFVTKDYYVDKLIYNAKGTNVIANFTQPTRFIDALLIFSRIEAADPIPFFYTNPNFSFLLSDVHEAVASNTDLNTHNITLIKPRKVLKMLATYDDKLLKMLEPLDVIPILENFFSHQWRLFNDVIVNRINNRVLPMLIRKVIQLRNFIYGRHIIIDENEVNHFTDLVRQIIVISVVRPLIINLVNPFSVLFNLRPEFQQDQQLIPQGKLVIQLRPENNLQENGNQQNTFLRNVNIALPRSRGSILGCVAIMGVVLLLLRNSGLPVGINLILALAGLSLLTTSLIFIPMGVLREKVCVKMLNSTTSSLGKFLSQQSQISLLLESRKALGFTNPDSTTPPAIEEKDNHENTSNLSANKMN